MACFHDRCGERVTLLNENRTALRDLREFNHGIVIGAEPLQDDVLFEVKIDEKMHSWSGSIEIGVTCCDPATIEFPSCASKLQNGSWIMSGNSILMNGSSIVEFYGVDLEKLSEEDRVGVMRTSESELVFFVNGESLGVATIGLPPVVYAVIDMYGKCVKISITHPVEREHNNDDCLSCDSAESECEIWSNSLLDDFRNIRLQPKPNGRSDESNTLTVMSNDVAVPVITTNPQQTNRDRIRFHHRCGSLVKLTGNQRTAERRRPLDEFNNGVVMTHRCLKNDELFEIRLDRLVDKWSGSIEMGITTHDPAILEFPATMTNMRSGTIMMSGCGILTNGKGTKREYGDFNLDELREGDRVGMMRRSNGNLHYFINGLDQGVAASKVPEQVWGVIDLYGMTIKVTIVDRDEREEQNLITRRNTLLQEQHMVIGEQMLDSDYCDRLTFHGNCGTHADVINNGRTALRPNAADDFNNGVVLTSRPLKPGELFEVRLNKVVSKWAGSIEIGVTTHSPTELEFPFTMTNVRSGTWMMTGNGVMHNGTTVLDQYGQNLDRLQVGDRVGAVRKENGTLHFFVNGIDQGPAASNVPEKVYGVVDLYGQAAQVTIIDTSDCCSPDTLNSSVSNSSFYSELRFHHVHGKNARVCNNGQTALRPHAFGEFNDAIVFSSRPLRDNELFEVTLDHMVDRWSGNIELGITAVKPDDVDLPSTATDLDRDTWMLSGCSVMENGVTIRNGYGCDLDVLTAGAKVGVLRDSDRQLHFYLNGNSQGTACRVTAPSVYAVVDLYGQCAQVSLTSGGATAATNTAAAAAVTSVSATVANACSTSIEAVAITSPSPSPGTFADLAHRFSECHGRDVQLSDGRRIATRGNELQNCILFGSSPLVPGESFEVSLRRLEPQYAGSIRLGITNFVTPDTPSVAPPTICAIPADCWYVSGSEVRGKGRLLRRRFSPSLEWLRVGDRIALRRSTDGAVHLLINGEDAGVLAHSLPDQIRPVLELFGTCVSVRITSSRPPSEIDRDEGATVASIVSVASIASVVSEGATLPSEEPPVSFHENRGRNVELSADGRAARRVASYNQGVVLTSRPLRKGRLVEVRVGPPDVRWVSSLICGVVCCQPERTALPVTALGFRKPCCILASDWICLNGRKLRSDRAVRLDQLTAGSRVGLLLTDRGELQLFIEGELIDSFSCELPATPFAYAVFDLYGRCQQLQLLPAEKADLELLETKEAVAPQLEQTLIESPVEPPPPPLLSSSRHCDYLVACLTFVRSLLLPDAFFLDRDGVCFCESCVRGDVAKAGPKGWVRFLLRNLTAAAAAVDKWHVAYCGSALGVVRHVLDRGQPLPPDRLRCSGLIAASDEQSAQLVFHPSVEYAASSTGHVITSRNQKKTCVRAAFELLVRPGSYSAQGQGDGCKWTTKETGAVVLHALLFKLQSF